jgi:hypothetical protein
VTTEIDVGFLAGDQEKLRTRLGAAGPVVGLQFAQAGLAGIGRMAVAMKIHDHRRVHSHSLKHRLERWDPAGAMFDRLYRVRVVPMRREPYIAVQGGEAVGMRVAEDAGECCRRVSTIK